MGWRGDQIVTKMFKTVIIRFYIKFPSNWYATRRVFVKFYEFHILGLLWNFKAYYGEDRLSLVLLTLQIQIPDKKTFPTIYDS